MPGFKFFLPLVIVFLFNSCSKDVSINYNQGQIRTQSPANVSFNSIYHLLDSLNLGVIELFGEQYYSVATRDYADSISAEFSIKRYLNGPVFTYYVSYLGDRVIAQVVFQKLTDNDVTDWNNTINKFHLTEDYSCNCSRVGVVKVPVGQEKYWVDKLKNYSIFEFVGLDNK